MAKEEPQLLNVQKAAAFLGINPSTIRQWAVSKKLHGVKVGSRGDWRFTKEELSKMIQIEKKKFAKIRKFLKEHAEAIQGIANQKHITYLGTDDAKLKNLVKNKDDYIAIVREFADNLENLKKGTIIFERMGENIAKKSVDQGLTLEETVDGTMFLKQAFWQKLEEEGLLYELTTQDFYAFNHMISTYTDIVASKIVFAYHDYYKQEEERVAIAQKKLEEQEAQWKFIYEEAGWGMAMFDPIKNNFITVNEAFAKMHGYTVGEMNGMNLSDTIAPESKKELPKLAKRAYKKGRIEYESIHIRKDGTKFPVLTDVTVYKDVKGDILFRVATFQNITERIESRQKVEESEEALHEQLQVTEAIANNASACLFMIDHNGLVTFMNPAAQQTTKYTQDEALGKPMHSLVHHTRPDGTKYPESECPLVQTYKHGKPNPTHEDIFFRKDGTPFPAMITGKPIPGPVGIRGTVVEFFDITAEKRAKEELQESVERFRVMADNIQNLAWMTNPDGWIFWYNKRWYEYTGTTFEKMQGWGWKKVHHPDHINRVVAFVKEAWKKGEPWELTFPLRRYDGQYQWFLTRAFPVRDESGKLVRWIGTNTNVDEQKRTEEALRESQKQKEEFIGIASHELKTPVTSVKAYAQVLQARFLKANDTKSAELVGKMDGQLNKLTNLIADLLDVTKIEGGKLQFHEGYFDIDELVEETIEEIQRTTNKHAIIKKLGSTKHVYADRDRTGQVLINLLANAIKYSPNAEKIIVKTRSTANSVTLCVQDFGLGLSKEDQKKVFDRFYRVDSSGQDTYPGLGLGLYISAEIIKRQNGKIWVESTKSKGSLFCFSLPLQKRD